MEIFNTPGCDPVQPVPADPALIVGLRSSPEIHSNPSYPAILCDLLLWGSSGLAAMGRREQKRDPQP